MAYTEKQWNSFQASLPVEDRMSYLDYLKETDPAEYSRVVSSILENLKKAELQSGNPITKVIDEGTRLSGAKTDTAAQKAAAVNAANALARLKAAEAGAKTTTPAPTPTTTTVTATKAPVSAEVKAIADKIKRNELLTDAEFETINAAVTPTVTGGTPTPTPTVTSNLTPTPTPTVTVTVGGTPAPTPTTTGNTPTPLPTPTLTGGTPTPTPTVTVTTTGGTPTPTPTVTTTGGTPTPTPTVTTTGGTPTPTPSITGTTPKPTPTPAPTADPNAARQSAYDLLYQQFAAYGLESLVKPLEDLITSNVSPAEFALKLRNDPKYNTQYKKRFGANDMRISKGLKAITEAEYLNLEDQYQNILRNAGLPDTYWKRGDLGVQEGFTNFIANDVSAVELEDRVSTAQQRVLFANPEVSIALKTFYPDITNGDLLAYALDPTKGLDQIKRRITAAEVGSSAVQMGLATNVTDAEYLARYGVNKAQAQQGYGTIAGGLQRGSQLASIYGENPYTQTTAEREVFNVPGAQESRAQRQKLTGLEKATFGGQTGLTSGALARDRAGSF